MGDKRILIKRLPVQGVLRNYIRCTMRCLNCMENFEINESVYKNGGGKFCCPECYSFYSRKNDLESVCRRIRTQENFIKRRYYANMKFTEYDFFVTMSGLDEKLQKLYKLRSLLIKKKLEIYPQI
jgi:protein-arginine kinase activator protein McsA